jgi:hypothetical protein
MPLVHVRAAAIHDWFAAAGDALARAAIAYSFAIARIRRPQLQLTAYRATDGTTLDSLRISK